MKKKTWKIIALVLALVLLGGVLFYANAFLGNPVSKLLATRNAKRYVAEAYAGTDYVVGEVSYSFKEGCYIADVSSPSSADTYFIVNYDFLGRRGYDSYEMQVVNRGNVWRRLEQEYRDLCDRVLEGDGFPYELDIAYGTLDTSVSVEEIPEPGVRPEQLPPTELELDRQYDIPALGAKYGKLVLYVEDTDVSVDRAAEILPEVRRLLEEGGAPFFYLDFVLEPPREEGKPRGETLNILNFPAADIYEEDMTQRVAEAAAEAEDYYAKMDAIRAAEEAAILETQS